MLKTTQFYKALQNWGLRGSLALWSGLTAWSVTPKCEFGRCWGDMGVTLGRATDTAASMGKPAGRAHPWPAAALVKNQKPPNQPKELQNPKPHKPAPKPAGGASLGERAWEGPGLTLWGGCAAGSNNLHSSKY